MHPKLKKVPQIFRFGQMNCDNNYLIFITILILDIHINFLFYL